MLKKAVRLADFLANPARDIEVFGMFGAGNLGDEAMLVAARQVLGQRRTLPWQSYANPTLNGLVRRCKHRNLLVSGGTLIHGGQTGWLDYVEHRANQGARITIFGTGIAFTEEQIRQPSDSFRRWGKILRNAAEVHLRGPRSVELAQQMGAEADIFGDFALMLYDPKIPLPIDAARQDVIGLNFGQCLGDQKPFEQSAAQLVRYLHGRHRLVFHAVVEGDVAVIARIAAAARLTTDQTDLRCHFYDPVAFMHEIRTYRAFLGLKLHAAALAMMAGMPSLMMVYMPKARDLMAGIGALSDEPPRQDLLIDLPLDTEQVIARLNDILTRPESAVLTGEIASIADRQRGLLRAAFDQDATT